MSYSAPIPATWDAIDSSENLVRPINFSFLTDEIKALKGFSYKQIYSIQSSYLFFVN